MTPDQHRRLLELFVAYSQETQTEAEHEELQGVLRTDVEARRLWFLHQDLEMGLKRLSQIATETADADVERGNCLPIRSKLSSRPSWLGRHNAVILAACLLCLSVWVLFGVHVWSRGSGDFTVESPTHGTTFALSEQKGKVIALHFLLKTECPFCLKLTNEYSRLAASESGVVHLFLKPDSADEIKVWAGKVSQEGLEHPPIIYRDPDARLADKFGIPDGYEFHGTTTHYPALVLLDGSGKEVFRYVGKDNTDRMKPDDFVTRLAMVTEHK